MSIPHLETHLRSQLDQVKKSRGFFWHRLRWAAVKSYLPKRGEFKLVDVGAGAGLLGEYLQGECGNGRYHFIEPIASLEGNLEARFGAGANLKNATKFEGARFVTLLDVLEHQEDDRAFIADIAGKMEPGTLLIITVPALQMLWSKWDVLLGHYRRYTRTTLRSVLEGQGVEILEVNYLFPEMIPPALFRKLKGSRENEGSGGSEFPEVPGWVNRLLYAGGLPSQKLRAIVPMGSSLIAVVRKI